MSELNASINTTENQICVSCPDDGVSRGCVIVLCHSQELQSTISYEILRSEGERCFRQEKSGDYTVAVFKQTISKTLHAIPLNVSVVSVSFSTPTTCKLLYLASTKLCEWTLLSFHLHTQHAIQ